MGWKLVVPTPYHVQVLQQAHGHPWASHQGKTRTLARVLEEFFWPGISNDVRYFCRACPGCQVASRRGPTKAPLVPMPIINTPFNRIALDFEGALPRSNHGYCYLLVLMDYATRNTEALPLKGMQVAEVAQALIQFFSRVGLPREILTDKGATFMSTLLKQLCQTLSIHQLFTTIYHPQMEGLVERKNQTLKDQLNGINA